MRRSGTGGLPVSGTAGLAGMASSVATDVARTAVDELVAQQAQRLTDSQSRSVGSASNGAGTVTAQISRTVEGDGPSDQSEDAQLDALMSLATSDEFRDRLVEYLEDRLLGEIERRGGRSGGWFA